ncbi:energy transducer TonB [Puniceicoccaceae bacterium K14]|nr:energy transducer TonB [Puniceicoccaceae bacterium K14]
MKRQLTLACLLMVICSLNLYSNDKYEQAYVKMNQGSAEAPKPINVETPDLDTAPAGLHMNVLLTVDAYGKVVSADVVESTDDRYNTGVTNTVKRWKFQPSIKNGVAVKSKVIVPIVVRNTDAELAMR